MINRIILLAIFAVIFSRVAQAQIGIGAKVGLNMSILIQNEHDRYRKSIHPGVAIGAVINFPDYDEVSSLQLELIYSQKGGRWKSRDDEFAQRMSYLEIPLLLKFSVGRNQIKGFVNTGPYLGCMIHAAEVYKSSSDKEVVRYGFNEFKDYKQVDGGINIGAGVVMALGSGEIHVETRYGVSIVDMKKSSGLDDSQSSYNSTISLSVIYLFRM